MTWLTEPFTFDFMQRALLAGALVAVTTSVVGTWVVLRGLAFMGDALAHGVLPGLALAFLLDINLTLGAVAGAVVMLAGITLTHRKARLTEDTAIGLLFVGMLALGVIIISRTGSFAAELTGFLFGDILGISTGDLWLSLIGAVVAVVVTVAFYRAFLVLAFNEQKARMLGLRPAVADALMMALITLAIVTSFRAVGTLLVFGLLVAPPAAAAQIVRRVPALMVTATLIATVSVVVGLVASWHLDTAGGATVSFVAVLFFFLVLIVSSLRRDVRI